MVIHCVFWWFIVIENCQPENRGKSMGFLLENRWKPIWTILKPTAPWFGIYFIRPPCIDQQWWCPWEFWDKCFVFREMMVVFLGTLGYCCYSGEYLMWYSWCNAEIMWSMAIAAVKSPYVGRFNHLKMWCTTNTLTWLYGHLWVYRYTMRDQKAMLYFPYPPWLGNLKNVWLFCWSPSSKSKRKHGQTDWWLVARVKVPASNKEI